MKQKSDSIVSEKKVTGGEFRIIWKLTEQTENLSFNITYMFQYCHLMDVKFKNRLNGNTP